MISGLTSGTDGINRWFAHPAAGDSERQQHQSHGYARATQQGSGRGGGGWGNRAKSNQGRLFEVGGEARTNGFGAFSAGVNITCWGLWRGLLREPLDVLPQLDYSQTGCALPLGKWRNI